MAETVNVACRLPHGLLLEVGFVKNTIRTANGNTVTKVTRGENYRTYPLKGSFFPQRQQRIQAPNAIVMAVRSPQPYLNRGVPKDIWDEWVKEHPNYFALKTGALAVVKDGEANAKAVSIDMMAQPMILAPLEQGKHGSIEQVPESIGRNNE